MSKHKHTIDEEELPVIALDTKRKPAKESGFQTKGWKFYLRIKELLPDWWYEFNGDIRSNHRPKYKTIEQFVKHKIKNKEEREYLLWMISPKKVWERESLKNNKQQVPWLGDWKARRRNGRWETENKEHIRHLQKSIHENVQSAQAIRATSPFIVKSLVRMERLADKIDELFGGEPFANDTPDNKHNLRRFKLYTSMHAEVEKLKEPIYEWWMRVHGIDPKNPHEMADMATMAQLVGQSSAAAALTGAYAGGMQPILNNGQPTGDNILQLNGQGIVISPDALLLAQHLTKHSKTFHKPLPSIDDSVVIEAEEPKKTNGHAKAN